MNKKALTLKKQFLNKIEKATNHKQFVAAYNQLNKVGLPLTGILWRNLEQAEIDSIAAKRFSLTA